MLRRAVPEAPARPWIVRIFYSTWFYLSLAGGLGRLRLGVPGTIHRRGRQG